MSKIYLLSFFILFESVLGGRDKIMQDLKRKSWITDKNFRKIIHFSFPHSLCCNAYAEGNAN